MNDILQLVQTLVLHQVLEAVPLLPGHGLGYHGEGGEGGGFEGVEVDLVGVWEGNVRLPSKDHAGDVMRAEPGHRLGVSAGECRGLRADKPAQAESVQRNKSQHFAQVHNV